MQQDHGRTAKGDAPFSLVRGGPFYRLVRALRLGRDDGFDVFRQGFVFACASWGPFAFLAIGQRLWTGSWDPLVLDLAVHVRLLVVIPLLVASEQALHLFTTRCTRRLIEDGYATVETAAPAIARATRWRDAWFPEIALLVVSIAAGQAVLWKASSSGVMFGAWGTSAISAVRVWYAGFALPLVEFLMLRMAWRWTIWFVFLWDISRLDLIPSALHPDERGGLSFFAEPARGFAVAGGAVGALLAGVWGGELLSGATKLAALTPVFWLVVLAAIVTNLGPLLVFSPCLFRARLAAVEEYDSFALVYTRAFHHKWIEVGGTEGLLGTSDIQSMADLAHTLEIIHKMRVVPFDTRDIVIVAAAMALPMLPLILASVPLPELIRRILGSATALGGLTM